MTVGLCDISKTVKIRQEQENKLKEVEKVMGLDQSRAFRLLLEIGYAGFTAVRDPSVVSMKNDIANLWDIPLLAELSPEAREATFAIWEKELGNTVNWIRKKNEVLMKRLEKEYETYERTLPLHKYRWGSSQIVSLPLKRAEMMVRTLETNLEQLRTYVGMRREYELRHGKRLHLYGVEMSSTTKYHLLLECSKYPGYEHTPSILAIAKTMKNRTVATPS